MHVFIGDDRRGAKVIVVFDVVVMSFEMDTREADPVSGALSRFVMVSGGITIPLDLVEGNRFVNEYTAWVEEATKV